MTKVNGYNHLSPFELEVLKSILEQLKTQYQYEYRIAEAIKILEA